MTKNGIEEHRADFVAEHPATKQSVAEENSVVSPIHPSQRNQLLITK